MGVDANRSDDTLSREISLLIADGIVTRRRASGGGIIKLIARRAIYNPRAKGASNLRTLRPIGPVHLKNLFHNPFLQPFYTTCGGAAPL